MFLTILCAIISIVVPQVVSAQTLLPSLPSLPLELNTTFGSLVYFATYGLLHRLKLGTDRRYVKIGTLFIRRHILSVCASLVGWWAAAVVYTLVARRSPFDAAFAMSQLGILSSMTISIMVLPSSRLYATICKLTKQDMFLLHVCLAAMFSITLILKASLTLGFYGIEHFERLEQRVVGSIGTSGLTALMGLSSMLRLKFYEVFFITHRISFILLLVASIIHSPLSGYYLAPAIISFVFDMIYRLIKTHKCKACRIEVIKDNDNVEYAMLDVYLSNIIPVYPNCYFLVNFHNIAPYEWHPLSLVEFDKNRYVFCVKNNGIQSWSGLLATYRSYERDKWRNRFEKNIYIQGPYGFSAIDYLSDKYTGLLFVCGGISILPLFSVLEDIVAKVESRHLRLLEVVEVVWIIRNHILYNKFIDKIPRHENIKFQCYITDDDIECVNCHSGRPDVKVITRQFSASHLKSECAVYTGGRYELVCEMKQVCSELGIELNCESSV